MRARLSAAVVSFNTCDITLRCMRAAQEAVPADSTLTLVDNGSTDGTLEAARQAHPAWRILRLSGNPGYGAALNAAFDSRPASFYLALNSDVLLARDSVGVLLGFLERHPDCGMVGPALAYPDGRPQASAKRFPSLGFALGELFGLHALAPRNRWVERFYYTEQDLGANPWVETVSGAVMLIRGEAFTRIRGFDRGYRMYFEETDLCRRLRDGGYRVAICPEATAIHWHGSSTIKTSVRQVEYFVSYIRFFRKHRNRAAACLLTTAVALSTVLRLLALPLKYPPVSPSRRKSLRAKLGECRTLLTALMPGVPAREPS
jgi:GT2 family glycosyltransferase